MRESRSKPRKSYSYKPSVYGTLDGGRTFSRFLLFNYATTGQHDFMLCDFKKNEVRENVQLSVYLKCKFSAELQSITMHRGTRACYHCM